MTMEPERVTAASLAIEFARLVGALLSSVGVALIVYAIAQAI